MTTQTLMTEAPSPSAADASPAAAPAGADTQAVAPAAPAPTDAQQPAAASDAKPTEQEAPADGKKADSEQKPADEDKKPAGAPEKYEFKAPEGTTLDAELLGEFEGLARELDMPQDKAQLVVDRLAPKVAQRMAAQQAEVVKQATEEWRAASTTDKEFGGAKLTASMSVVAKAMATFGTPELRTLLDESGLGNHPEVIRVFYRAGQAISEDRIVTGHVGATPANGNDARSLYPNSNLN